MRAASRLAALVAVAASALVAASGGCGPMPKGPSTTSPTPCWEGFHPTGFARADLERLGRRCGPTEAPIAPPVDGLQSQSAPSERLWFAAGGEGRCYRVYAVGGVGVLELDVMVRGLDGEPLVRDETRGGFAVVPSSSWLCLPDEGLYQLEVAVSRGDGPYLVEVREAR